MCDRPTGKEFRNPLKLHSVMMCAFDVTGWYKRLIKYYFLRMACPGFEVRLASYRG